jgi:poly-beta-hydroxyalkanoate depolymerase
MVPQGNVARSRRARKCIACSRGVGHYHVFNDRRWRDEIYPCVRNFILANA